MGRSFASAVGFPWKDLLQWQRIRLFVNTVVFKTLGKCKISVKVVENTSFSSLCRKRLPFVEYADNLFVARTSIFVARVGLLSRFSTWRGGRRWRRQNHLSVHAESLVAERKQITLIAMTKLWVAFFQQFVENQYIQGRIQLAQGLLLIEPRQESPAVHLRE
mmetsp:Transcript_7504/g.21350  ORF Transcript_7504/g.21350 Transcript_7504/m.21350 type:complete len:162 (+) Transcript_7504:283-768(+)